MMQDNDVHGEAGMPRRNVQLAKSLEELNARIGILAHVLHADLSTEVEVQRILARTHPVFLQPAPSAQGLDLAAGERRIAREWEELRGLLALRCDLMAHALAELGLPATQLITELVQSHRDKEGLQPDSDGFHLRHHFGSAPSD